MGTYGLENQDNNYGGRMAVIGELRLSYEDGTEETIPTASYHMDTRAFFHKFQRDLMDDQEYLDGVVPNYVPNIGYKRDAVRYHELAERIKTGILSEYDP